MRYRRFRKKRGDGQLYEPRNTGKGQWELRLSRPGLETRSYARTMPKSIKHDSTASRGCRSQDEAFATSTAWIDNMQAVERMIEDLSSMLAKHSALHCHE